MDHRPDEPISTGTSTTQQPTQADQLTLGETNITPADFDQLVTSVVYELGRGTTEQAIRDLLVDNHVASWQIDQIVRTALERQTQSVSASHAAIAPDASTPPQVQGRTILFSGRLSRRGFWIGHIYVSGIFWLLYLAPYWIGELLTRAGNGYPLSNPWSFTWFVLVLAVTATLGQSILVRRAHDSQEMADDASVYLVGGDRFTLRLNPYWRAGDKGVNRYGPPMNSLHPLVILGLRRPPVSDAQTKGGKKN